MGEAGSRFLLLLLLLHSEWYKRNLKLWLFIVGFVLACIFNVDTIEVYQSVSSNAIMNEELVAMATDFTNRTDSVTGPNLNLSLDQSIARLDSSLKHAVAILTTGLTLGNTVPKCQPIVSHTCSELAIP